jgi:hypothetical protein
MKANRLQGSFLRLSERHEIAIYLRDGVPYVAEFRGGQGELHALSAWVDMRNLGSAPRRAALDPIVPIPPEVTERIERLHRSAAKPAGLTADFVAAWVGRLADAIPRLKKGFFN